MTIDERLEKLVDRHEALTHGVELLKLETEKHDRQIAKVAELIGEQARVARRQQSTMDDLMDAVGRLANITGEHRDRIDEHTERLDNLEQT